MALRSTPEFYSTIVKVLAEKESLEKAIARKQISDLCTGEGFHQSRVTGHESRNLRQRQAWSRDNAGHAQDLLIFLFRNGRNNQANIFQKLQLPNQGFFPEFVGGTRRGHPSIPST